MDRLLLVAALVIVAVGVAVVLQRRRPRPAPTNAGHRLPDRVDRADFERADAPITTPSDALTGSTPPPPAPPT